MQFVEALAEEGLVALTDNENDTYRLYQCMYVTFKLNFSLLLLFLLHYTRNNDGSVFEITSKTKYMSRFDYKALSNMNKTMWHLIYWKTLIYISIQISINIDFRNK